MIFRSLTVALTLSMISTGAVAKQTTEKKEPVRTVANSESSRRTLAQKYMEIAETLAQARKNGETCELGAYANDILSAVRRARTFDETIQATPAVQAVLGESIAYRWIFGAELGSDKYPAALVGTRFYSPAMGAYGSTEQLVLQAGGKLVVRRLDIEADPIGWKETAGSWIFTKGRVVFTIETNGKKFTRSYFLNTSYYHDDLDGALIPANRFRRLERSDSGAGYQDIRYFSIPNGDCEA